MNEYNNIKNRFDTDQVIRQTVNPSSLSVIEAQQNYDNNLKRSIVRNFVKDLESLGWDIREDSNGSIMIETEYDKEYYSSYSDAFDVYKDTIVDDVYQGILDKEGYYNFYLGKEQIRYLGLEKEYEKQMEHAVEGVNHNLEDIDDSVNDILLSTDDEPKDVESVNSTEEISADTQAIQNTIEDGSTATSSNDDTEVQNQNGEHVSSNDSSSEYSNANSEDSNTHSEQENTDTDVDCSKNTVTYEDSRTQDVVLLLMNNLDVIKKVPDKNYEIHAKEDFYKDTEKKYPYIFRENNNYKILINESMTLGCRSELGAKLLVALYNDRDAKKFIDSDLDNGYVDGIYQDLNNASKVKDANVDKSLQALQHMKLDLENTTSTMRTNV